jgi:RecA-family ATPase
MSKQKSEEKIRFSFTQDIQMQIFATLFECDPRYESRILKLLEPGYFTNPVHQNLFKIFKAFFNEYSRVPSTKEFLDEVRRFLSQKKNRRLSEDEYLDCVAEIIKISRNEHLDFAYDRIIEFCKYQEFSNALLNAAEKRAPILDIEGLQEDLTKIQEIGIDFEDDAGLQLIPLSEVEAGGIDWLWWHVIPTGKLTFLVGDPDVGKSFLSMFIASKISTGEPLPNVPKELAKKGTVLLLQAEDAPSDTILPRILNTGGDTSKILILKGTREKDSIKLFNFVEDLPRLEEVLERRRDIKLVIVDPITAYMKKVDYFKDTDVRGKVIAPLFALADKYKIGILLIAHMTKDESKKAIYRLGGSIGLLAGARCVWIVLQNTSDKNGEWRKLACIKMNIAKKPTKAMSFQIYEPRPDEPTLSFSDNLVDCDIENELSGKQRKIDLAKDFLRDFLKYGKRKSEEVYESGKANNHSKKTIRRAKEILEVVVFQEDGAWYWKLPVRKGTNIRVQKEDDE